MTLAWITYAFVVGSLLALTARCLEEVSKLAGRPARWAWTVALGVTIALVAIAPFRAIVPPSPVAAVTVTRNPNVAPLEDIPTGETPTPAGRPVATSRQELSVIAASAMTWLDQQVPSAMERHLLWAWLTMSLGMFAWFSTVYLRFRRNVGRWPVAPVQDAFVRMAPEAGPAVVGVWHPQIVMPRWLLDRSVDEQRLALAHEQEHVRAHDPLLLALGCAAVALLPWHPAVWWMYARLRLTVELDCDRRVVRRGVTPRRYGMALIDLAERCTGLPVSAPALADNRSHLRQRILAMTRQHPRFLRIRVALLSAVASVVFAAAYQAQVPQSNGGREAVASPKAPVDSVAIPRAKDVGTDDGKAITATPTAAKRRIRAEQARSTGRTDSIHSVESAKNPVGLVDPRTPGLTLQQSDSLKNPARLRLRGMSSAPQTDKNPVVVVDGVRWHYAPSSVDASGQVQPGGSPLDQLDPNSIETIEILEERAAVTLYGKDGAHGAIIITTKQTP